MISTGNIISGLLVHLHFFRVKNPTPASTGAALKAPCRWISTWLQPIFRKDKTDSKSIRTNQWTVSNQDPPTTHTHTRAQSCGNCTCQGWLSQIVPNYYIITFFGNQHSSWRSQTGAFIRCVSRPSAHDTSCDCISLDSTCSSVSGFKNNPQLPTALSTESHNLQTSYDMFSLRCLKKTLQSSVVVPVITAELRLHWSTKRHTMSRTSLDLKTLRLNEGFHGFQFSFITCG